MKEKVYNNKLLIIDLGKEYGGAEKLIENIIVGLKSDTEVHLIINSNGDFAKKGKIFNDCKVVSLENSSKKFIGIILKVIKYVKKENITIVQCNGTPSNIVGIVLKMILRIRFISTIHSDISYEFEGLKRYIYLKIEKYTAKYADIMVAVSKNLEDKLKNRYPKFKDTIKLIYNGVEVKNTKDKKYDNNPKRLLFVGRLVEIKNVEYLIKGLTYLKENNKNFICDIIGEGPLEEKLKDLVNSCNLQDNVNFLGFKSDVKSYMENSDVFIMTSIMEGIPLVIIEAFATKLPVVASAVGGVNEMIENNESGILYNLNNVDSFNKILMNIVDDKVDLKRLARNAYIEYKNKWSRDRLIKDYKKAFKI